MGGNPTTAATIISATTTSATTTAAATTHFKCVIEVKTEVERAAVSIWGY